ncbi:MAG: hypothetical protein LBK26_03110 [Rickettsiales bacterium]|jgi:hypothetical protein|nr:hypothetical protein [Rickettsiales bacterium]
MKQLTKNFFMFASILSISAVLAGCSSSTTGDKKSNEVNYVQTHEDDDITKLSARMFQRFGAPDQSGNESGMGRIWFRETDSGLQMVVDLQNVRPGVEYTFYVYDMTDSNKKAPKKSCKKKKMDISFPTVKGDADRNLKATFMVTGLAAADIKGAKITLNRPDASGEEIAVGWGMLKERRLF